MILSYSQLYSKTESYHVSFQFVTKLSPSMATMDQHIAHLKRGPALLLFLSQKGGSSKRSLEVLREVCMLFYKQKLIQLNVDFVHK